MKKAEELKKEILDCELCTGCGTCVGVCPTRAIDTKKNHIIIDKEKCVDCGRCVEVCPGKEFLFDEWGEKITGARYNRASKLGNYIGMYKMHSKAENVREKSASGGAVTQICLDLFRAGKIDGVVSIKGKENNCCEFEPFLAKSEEDIILSAQSKYVVIPTNSILRLLRNEKIRIAYVGLPCQVQGLRKAMEKEKWLKDSVVVIISLFCGFNMEYSATEYLIQKSGIKCQDICELEYRRKKKEESGFYIKSKNGREFFVPKHGYTFMNLIFSPKRCWKCFDYSGEFADISVGDAWENKEGCSRVIVRTKKGEKIIEDCRLKNSIFMEECFSENVIKTQNNVIGYKKEQIYYRKKYMKNFPDYGIEFNKPKNSIKAVMLYGVLVIFKTNAGKLLVNMLPFKILTKVSKAIKGNEVK